MLHFRTRQGRAALLAAAATVLFLPASTFAQVILAESEFEFSGVQGQDDWTHGWRNLTVDGGADDYDATNDFIAFTGGSDNLDPWDGVNQQWNGNAWDLNTAAAQPWTFLGPSDSHPNGSNQPEIHWTIRRWTAPGADLTGPTLLQVDYFIGKNNGNGTGVSAQLHHNGVMIDKTTIAGNDQTGITKSIFLTVDVGDHVDLAHTPEGPGANLTDGSDSSTVTMVIQTVVDTDSDSLPDSWEETFFPGDLTQLSTGGDRDGEGLLDQDEFANGTDPSNPDTDDDGYTDKEEIDAGTNPSDVNSVPPGIADSMAQFSGVDGQDGWRWGYRNVSQDGSGINYDAENDFIPFPVDGTTTRTATNFWNGTNYDWFNDPPNPAGNAHNPPWTSLAQEGTHPNGVNNGDEHWTVRRWTASGFGGETPVRIVWHMRKTNLNGTGTTGAIHINGTQVDTAAIAGNDGAGFIRTYYAHLNDGDIVDQVLTPVGLNGDPGDGADGSANWMRIDDRLPSVPTQPNGKIFVPNNAEDSDGDSLGDFWEEVYFPGDLTALADGQDWDLDGSHDDAEQAAGTDPTNPDTDADGLTDGEEATAGSNPCEPDTDGDGLTDFEEVTGNPSTDPTNPDTDGDGFSDPVEIADGSNPNDPNETPLTGGLADSVTQFSGIQGQDGWDWGYRNVTLDGKGTDYDPVTDFIPFAGGSDNLDPWDGVAQQWNNNAWDLETAAAQPWTYLAAEQTHPNGTNNGDEHWTVRRWNVSGLPSETPARITWHTRGNGVGDGTTGAIHLNGVQVDAATVAGGDQVGVTRIYYLHLQDGDFVDQVLTPVGVTNTGDGSDTSFNWMRIDTRVPDVPQQPNGKYFIPNDAEDTDTDGLADFWEEVYFPGDLTQLASGQDFDGDGSKDEDEQAHGLDPTNPDTDGDGLSDGDEATAGTDPCDPDTDGDLYSDFHEVATGYDPLDEFDNVEQNFLAHVADSIFDFPLGLDFPQDGNDGADGFNGWSYGYYNVTQDGEPPANTNFIPFPTDGTIFASSTNHWDGSKFDWFDDLGATVNPPWTEIAQEAGHPNGDNNVDIHWAVRRWRATVTEPTDRPLGELPRAGHQLGRWQRHLRHPPPQRTAGRQDHGGRERWSGPEKLVLHSRQSGRSDRSGPLPGGTRRWKW